MSSKLKLSPELNKTGYFPGYITFSRIKDSDKWVVLPMPKGNGTANDLEYAKLTEHILTDVVEKFGEKVKRFEWIRGKVFVYPDLSEDAPEYQKVNLAVQEEIQRFQTEVVLKKLLTQTETNTMPVQERPNAAPTTPTSSAALGNGSQSLLESGSPTLADLMLRMEEMHHDLGSKLDDVKQGMAIIYRDISAKDQTTITMILEDVRQGRIEQGEIQNELDAIRKVLRHIHTTTLPIADTVKKSLDDIYQAVNSNLSFHQQLELTLPVIPFLLEYKIGLDAGVDLGAVWKELGERLGKGSG